MTELGPKQPQKCLELCQLTSTDELFQESTAACLIFFLISSFSGATKLLVVSLVWGRLKIKTADKIKLKCFSKLHDILQTKTNQVSFS